MLKLKFSIDFSSVIFSFPESKSE